MTVCVDLRHKLGAFYLDAQFEAPAGITALFGRSGSGKTTLVNCLAGLLRADEARIWIENDVLQDTGKGLWTPPHRRDIGYIFQEGRLFPHMSVQRNLSYGHRPQHAAEFDRVVEMLGLAALLKRRPGALSGGEKQRVAIGRALLSHPKLILADEPLAALDDARKAEILPYFERLRDETSVPILYVSHSAAEVARLATTVVVLERGRVVRDGPTATVMADPMVTPTGVRAAGAVIEAIVQKQHEDGLTELSAGGAALFIPHVSRPPGTRIRVRIAAQDVILARQRPEGLSALNILGGRVKHVREGDGPGALVSLETPAGTLLARITRRSAATLGLNEGVTAHAVIKTVAIAPEDVGHA